MSGQHRATEIAAGQTRALSLSTSTLDRARLRRANYSRDRPFSAQANSDAAQQIVKARVPVQFGQRRFNVDERKPNLLASICAFEGIDGAGVAHGHIHTAAAASRRFWPPSSCRRTGFTCSTRAPEWTRWARAAKSWPACSISKASLNLFCHRSAFNEEMSPVPKLFALPRAPDALT
jgi:hypothetical protein